MKHQDSKRILSRKTGPRRALLKGLVLSLVLHEKIKTTAAKAKSLRPLMENIITRAKIDNLHNRREILKKITAQKAVKKLFEVIGPRYKDRQGGYLRIIKLKARKGDAAKIALIELV
ncbi:50S ribosomal protein L17 [Candidatus Kuenenbacteria bacterium CG23_combo_of_CG06-09_8_20_14_all_36_9]|uniref:Large ribosomal subunit protein bL17 n=1 Tax=Candidatus Kuenenbacteria bacterium CG10_big_fil_rev_8_21_14_0_10_36_11 TaxID=1974618 RepID=A0A2M6WBC3_9BACT|nr:MAG: 50S ribosomal protein L17 [Candidatus Kuenenbacteria bacterium CG23_combo_of_CG06-09_8_20_14_all_36_9]PIT90096.1 MAG: 50S ribosomal protein L17 [Candidatus Kuenenbacteria bacterium CG10_big_fil_rev_8_21_14_0_10_36_11]